MSWYKTTILIWLSAFCFLTQTPVYAHPPPPQANDIFGTVNGCASALVEMDKNFDGMVKKDEYLDFVNLLADFLCVPPRPRMDLEIQTVFFSIACLCQEREGFDQECCFGADAAIYTQGAADAIVRTEDQDSYLRAACLLTQSILGPQQCTIAPATLSPDAIVTVGRVAPLSTGRSLSDEALWAIIIGAILLALLCCLLLCCACKKKKEEEEEEIEEVIIKPEDVEEGPKGGEVDADEVKKIEPVEVRSAPPIYESNSVPAPIDPAPAPAPTPVIIPTPAPVEESDDSEASSNIGRKTGVTIEDDSDEEHNRKFGGQGMLPGEPGAEGIVLRHVEVEKEEPPEYEYPEREFHEHKLKREDSGQILDHYVPDGGVYFPERDMNFKGYEADGGVYDPQRPTKAPVVFNAPKYQRKKKPEKEVYDPRKFRSQLAMGDGEVWDSLAAHEEAKAQTKENKFEWIVQGALDVLAKAQESGELTKPKPKRAVSPEHQRTSDSPPPRARAAGAAPQTPPTKGPLKEVFSV